MRNSYPERCRLVASSAFLCLLGASMTGCAKNKGDETGDEMLEARKYIEVRDTVFDIYTVGQTSLHVPRDYAVRNGATDAISVLTYWPGLVDAKEAAARGTLNAANQVIVILRKPSQETDNSSRSRALEHFIERERLSSAFYDEQLGLHVYRTPKDLPRLLSSADRDTPFGELFFITCSTGPDRPPEQQECRAEYQLTGELRLQYRYPIQLIANWEEIDAAAKHFALELTDNPRGL